MFHVNLEQGEAATRAAMVATAANVVTTADEAATVMPEEIWEALAVMVVD